MMSTFRIGHKGFSLFELMMVLMVIVGLLIVSLPLGRRFYRRNVLEVRVNQIVSAIQYAKDQAIVLDKPVVLEEFSDKDGWSSGMRLFVDQNGNRHFEPGDTLVRVWKWSEQDVSVDFNGFRSDHYLLFERDLSEQALSGRFRLSLGKGKNAHVQNIVINRLGRIRVHKS